MKHRIPNPLVTLTSILFAVSALPASAAVTFTVTETRPGETAVTNPSTTLGSVTYTPAVPTTTYTISGLDFTSIGGGASETIAFDIAYSQTGGSGVEINSFGNISVTGLNNNLINLGETLTATISLNSSSFGGTINLGLTSVTVGGVSTIGSGDEFWDIVHDGGTIEDVTGTGAVSSSFASSSFFTIVTQDGPAPTDGVNLQEFTVEITAIPEPSAALLGGLGLLALLRRRR